MSNLEIPLNALPYGIARRLVDLMPLETVAKFRKINPETEFLTKRRTITVNKLETSSGALLKWKKPHCVQRSLWISFASIAEADQVIPYISGTYHFMCLGLNYSWRHAIDLCHPKVESCHWYGNMELHEQDHDEFIIRLLQLFAKRPITMCFSQTPDFFSKLQFAVGILKRDVNVPYYFKECKISQPILNYQKGKYLIYIICKHYDH